MNGLPDKDDYPALIVSLREKAELTKQHSQKYGFRGGKNFEEHLLNDAADAIESLTKQLSERKETIRQMSIELKKYHELCDVEEIPEIEDILMTIS